VVKRQALALRVSALLRLRCSQHAGRPLQALFEQHERAQRDAQGLEEIAYKNFHA